ncbi:hypothetical protein CY34DRAFT_21132 [Suillus luteus UH-Slu-Lm8-n1]|uniref:Pre-mRNA-splicing factor SYF2 n=1 Tax=Suillus luteus UH-Slu-Lm8-n1 TaxID=930992 RepID=A0A0D0BQM7_9AGAM|nr:hypothetical protein CY34DRAFT_21132 [Suillus luteus UH-Slu-Lm8-n1]
MSSSDGEEKGAGQRSPMKANRASLIEESARAKMTVRDAARLERQRKLAEVLRTQAEAGERTKKARKARRADYEFHDDAYAARRHYKKDLDLIKPDLAAYSQQKEVVLGLAPGSLAKSGIGSSALIAFDPSSGQSYRDANTLLYAGNKPTEDAIDRVVGEINRDIDKKGKFSRKRLDEDEGEITYINERNRVFNKKIARYYHQYTSEIRASFEPGTAL